MAGLLDLFNSPEGQQALGLLAAGGPQTDPSKTGFGQRLAAASGFADQWKQKQMLDEIQRQKMAVEAMNLQKGGMELQSMQQQFSDGQAMRGAAQESFVSPERANAMSMGPTESGGAVAPVKSGFDQKSYLSKLYGINPEIAMKYEQSLAKDTPFGKIDPKDYTQASIAAFNVSRNPADLVAARKKEVVNNQVVDMYNAQEGKVFDNIDPNKPFNLVAGKPVANTDFQQYEIGKARAGAPKVAVDLRDPTAVAGAAMKLQNDFRAATKASFARAQAYESMVEAAANPSPKGDLTMVYSFVKALDPESVVREGEISLLNANRSVPDSIKGYAQRLATGQSLLPKEREDLINQARTLTQTDYKRSRNDIQAYRENASRLGVDPQLYTPDPYATFKPKEDKPQAGNGAKPLPANPSASTLEKGAAYKLPNGATGVWDGMRFKGQ